MSMDAKEESVPMAKDYNTKSVPQGKAAVDLYQSIQEFVVPRLLSSTKKGSVIRVMDNGCATGGNTAFILSQLVREIATETDSHLKAYLNDIPGNEWDILTSTMQSKMSAEIAQNQFSFETLPKTAYGGLLSADGERMNLVYSSTTLHWITVISTLPLANPAAILPQSDSSDSVRKSWTDSAARDWNVYLQERGKETVQGGFIALMIIEDHNTFLTMMQAAKKKLLDDGDMTEGIARKLYLPIYLREHDEIMAGFDEGVNGNLVWKDTWEVMNIRNSKFQCPFTSEFLNKKHSNEERVDGVVNFCKGFAGPTFLSRLSDVNSAENILDHYWATLKQLGLENPVEDFQTTYGYKIIVMKRI